MPDPIPAQLRRAICVYEAGKVRAARACCPDCRSVDCCVPAPVPAAPLPTQQPTQIQSDPKCQQALLAYITPDYDEIARISICPYNIVTGEREGREREGAVRREPAGLQ